MKIMSVKSVHIFCPLAAIFIVVSLQSNNLSILYSSTEQFESFLMTLLYYFEAYFELQNLENKPKPMATYVIKTNFLLN